MTLRLSRTFFGTASLRDDGGDHHDEFPGARRERASERLVTDFILPSQQARD